MEVRPSSVGMSFSLPRLEFTSCVSLDALFPSTLVHEDYRQKLSAQLKGEMLYILDCINTSENYLPELGSSQADCDNVIDFSMPEVSPYRFKISYVTGDSHQQQGKTAALRRFWQLLFPIK